MPVEPGPGSSFFPVARGWNMTASPAWALPLMVTLPETRAVWYGPPGPQPRARTIGATRMSARSIGYFLTGTVTDGDRPGGSVVRPVDLPAGDRAERGQHVDDVDVRGDPAHGAVAHGELDPARRVPAAPGALALVGPAGGGVAAKDEVGDERPALGDGDVGQVVRRVGVGPEGAAVQLGLRHVLADQQRVRGAVGDAGDPLGGADRGGRARADDDRVDRAAVARVPPHQPGHLRPVVPVGVAARLVHTRLAAERGAGDGPVGGRGAKRTAQAGLAAGAGA